MKVVSQLGKSTKVEYIPEFQLERKMAEIISQSKGKQITPLPHEVFRFKTPTGVIYITKTKRKHKSRESWFEPRALSALSKKTRQSYTWKKEVRLESHISEIDGFDETTGTIVEVTTSTITQNWLDFYELKRKNLKQESLCVIAPAFVDTIRPSKQTKLYKIRIDWKPLRAHYKDFTFPDWIRDVIPSRHVRFLLDNGYWKGVGRSLTNTAKHSMESKFKETISQLLQKGNHPVKAYYSMARMINPPREYTGKGYPLPRLIPAFDIDPEKHTHVIGQDGVCIQCMEESREKAKSVKSILENLGYETRTIVSGSKGFHIYITSNDRLLEWKSKQYESVLEKIGSLTDSSTFTNISGDFDLHRILKMPGTVDGSTGLIVSRKMHRLKFKDKLYEI